VHGLFADVSRRQSERGPKFANPSEGTCAMASLYSTKVTASGGRHSSIRSEDGLFDIRLALPRVVGGRGDATKPEQLFSGGYAACFENTLLHVSRVRLPEMLDRRGQNQGSSPRRDQGQSDEVGV
jgi:organic hydroperoxide reductase OsmC/OhrA